MARVLGVFAVFLRLGLTSFGGPAAHIGYFRAEFVTRRRWLEERTFADLIALCQFLPGPTSSQLGISIGTSRAGLPGGLAAWLGFSNDGEFERFSAAVRLMAFLIVSLAGLLLGGTMIVAGQLVSVLLDQRDLLSKIHEALTGRTVLSGGR